MYSSIYGMERFKHPEILAKIGKRIENQRTRKELEVEDVVEMTGFTANTIRQIEAGKETSLSYFVEICKALEVHPKDIFNFPINSKTRFKLSASRQEKSRLTFRIRKLIKNNFFNITRTAKNTAEKLEEDYNVSISTSKISVILDRMEKEGLLMSKMNDYRKEYSKKIRP